MPGVEPSLVRYIYAQPTGYVQIPKTNGQLSPYAAVISDLADLANLDLTTDQIQGGFANLCQKKYVYSYETAEGAKRYLLTQGGMDHASELFYADRFHLDDPITCA